MKKFLIKLSYTILPLWLLVVGVVVYISVYVSPRISGDIGRLACIPFGHEYNQFLEQSMLKDTLFVTINDKESIKKVNVDVVTIGDSFGQLGKGGFQNYLGLMGVKVANYYRNLYTNPIQFAYNMMDHDIIDSTVTRVLIVESAERDIEDYIKLFDVNTIEPARTVSGNKVSNSWSVARARDYILYNTGMSTPIYKAKLNNSFFTSDEPDALYFYKDEIANGVSISKINEGKVKKVFDEMVHKAEEKGIRLILMVASDKYDVYQGKIMKSSFPKKTVNEDLVRILGEDSNLLLTKPLIMPLIEAGEKDVYLFNDTHWSYKSSKVIADELYGRITKCF